MWVLFLETIHPGTTFPRTIFPGDLFPEDHCSEDLFPGIFCLGDRFSRDHFRGNFLTVDFSARGPFFRRFVSGFDINTYVNKRKQDRRGFRTGESKPK